MKHCAITDPPEKRSPTFFLAFLLILVFSLASFAAIMLIDAQKVPTLENNTAWLQSYFAEVAGRQSGDLSEQQEYIIHNSAAIISNVAQDAGVTVSLQAVCGNGYYTYFKLDIELPEGINAEQGRFFKDYRLGINDNNFGLGSMGTGAMTLEDDNPMDNHYSLLITTRLNYYPYCGYSFDNDIVRTLHLEDIRINDENGEVQLIKGQWELDVLFYNEGKAIELIQEPVTVRGYDRWEGKYFEAEITSFALTEFTAYSQYKVAEACETAVEMRPVVIMKDGRSVPMGGNGGGGSRDRYEASFRSYVPISLDEVAFVKLSDEVFLPVYPIKSK